jgi:DNA polymerase-3 subunit gamma/tau
MSYLALARKWRPRRFAELVGQEHVVRVLTHALASGRIHHALLFAGTRGVGKTTLARIFAKALQCEEGVRAEPCGHCGSCREIDEGCHPDLVEIDAASNTGVDHVRDLIEGAQYAPVRGRFKVYLIDEVHMLSRSAFNALLKTLEEPPGHVRFLFATTDPERLPATVLSRCLRLSLVALESERIASRLAFIAEREGILFEPEAMQALARAAEGSLRDGLSLLDQAIAFGGGRVIQAEVEAMLGWVGRDRLPELLSALSSGEAQRVEEVLSALTALDPDHASLLAALAEGLHRLQVARLVPGAVERLPSAWQPLAAVLSDETLQLWYQIALLGRRDLPLAPSRRIGFEMTVWRMFAFRPVGVSHETAASPAATERRKPAGPPLGEGSRAAGGEDAPRAILPDAQGWPAFLLGLGLSGPEASLAEITRFGGFEGELLRLEIDAEDRPLLTPTSRSGLERALGQALGRALRVEISVGRRFPGPTLHQHRRLEDEERRREALAAAEADATVRALRSRLGARILPDSIEPT